MARTFVRVELIEPDSDAYPPMWAALEDLGFVRTIKGKKTGKAFRLPRGLYLLEAKTPDEALTLAKQAIVQCDVEARVMCIPAAPGVRFGNLQDDDEATEDEMFEP